MFAVHAIRQTTLQVDAPVPAKQAAEERRASRILVFAVISFRAVFGVSSVLDGRLITGAVIKSPSR